MGKVLWGIVVGFCCFFIIHVCYEDLAQIDGEVETPTHLNEVKLSVNGLCHPKGSQYYDYIKHFTQYRSLSQCVLDGGRVPVRVVESNYE